MKNILISAMRNTRGKIAAKSMKTIGAVSAILLALVMLFSTILPTLAAPTSSGPNNAGTGANVTGVGTLAWANPGNISPPTSPYSTAVFTAAATTNYLEGTNYGFAIPAVATITGIQVDISRSSSVATIDNIVQLVKAGVITGVSDADITTPWPATLTAATYDGGTGHMWGTTWTPADINAVGFGVALSATSTGAGTATVESIQVTVTYTTGSVQLPVDLGLAGNFAVLAETKITNANGSTVVGNMGLSPAVSAANITGWALTMDSSGVFATSTYVTGGYIYAADYADPTPAHLTTAVNDMLTAYNNAANGTLHAADATELGAGNITGMTLVPGVYKWSTGVLITAPGVTLSGNGVYIFQIAGDLTMTSNATVNLSGGALASNIFWQVGGPTGAILGTTTTLNGTILSAKQVTMAGGGTLNGRALAQTEVTMDGVASGTSASGVAPVPNSSGNVLTSNANPSTYGDAVTFTATVTGATPTGPVQFKNGTANLGLPVLLNGSGVATYTTSSLVADSYSITAVYAGDLNNAGSTSNVLTQVVNQKPITVTAKSASKYEHSADPPLTYIVNPALISGDSFSGSLIRATGETPGNYQISLGSLTAGSNYSITYVPAQFTIISVFTSIPAPITTTIPPTTTTAIPLTTTTATPSTTPSTTIATTSPTTPVTTTITTTAPVTTTTPPLSSTIATTSPTTTTAVHPTTSTTTPAKATAGFNWLLIAWIVIGVLFIFLVVAVLVSSRPRNQNQ